MEAPGRPEIPAPGFEVKLLPVGLASQPALTRGYRYQYHPPKYNRGPLHPIQSPAASDPVARDYVPGPFNLPRLRDTYQSTIASDLMAMAYQHKPPGTEPKPIKERLRAWDDASPYHKNRPRRGPRGSGGLKPIEQEITFRNIPELLEVTIASYVPKGIKETDHLLVARTALLAISGETPVLTKTKANVQQWGIKIGERAGVKVTIHGNAAYEFLDRCLNFVFPQIKDWPGIKGELSSERENNINLQGFPWTAFANLCFIFRHDGR